MARGTALGSGSIFNSYVKTDHENVGTQRAPAELSRKLKIRPGKCQELND